MRTRGSPNLPEKLVKVDESDGATESDHQAGIEQRQIAAGGAAGGAIGEACFETLRARKKEECSRLCDALRRWPG